MQELSRSKAAVLTERGQAEEELIKARNQARLEEVSFGHKYGEVSCSTLQRSLVEGAKIRAVGLRTRAQEFPAASRTAVLPALPGKRKARGDSAGLRCPARDASGCRTRVVADNLCDAMKSSLWSWQRGGG